MPRKADGEVWIKTNIDNSKAQKDLDKLTESIEEQEKNIAKIEKKREEAKEQGVFSAAELDKEKAKLQELKKNLDEINNIKSNAKREKVSIQDNSGYISRAERQCVNARIQGGAATMSKIAMRKVYDSKELRDLGFSLLLQVHDELIGECPAENAEKVADLLTGIMNDSRRR